VSLFDYDYDELAAQIQHGLERIAVNFLRAHGARVRRDTLDFHGIERIDLELEAAGHSLTIHQAGRPRSSGDQDVAPGPADEFESLFDGWPVENTAPETIALWLASLPLGEAPPERSSSAAGADNPFARERQRSPRTAPEVPGHNPFLGERSGGSSANPFADSDAERRRQETLRRLRGDN
jgi:hypothetical protein